MSMLDLRVLVIDDNPGDVLLLKEAFSEAKIPLELLVAENAVEAYTWMRDLPESEAPDLILLDLNLPIIKGQTVLRELRSHRPWWKARVVILSSSSAKHEINECLKQGAAECLVKPANFDDYIELAKYLRHSCEPLELSQVPKSQSPEADRNVVSPSGRRSSVSSQQRRSR